MGFFSKLFGKKEETAFTEKDFWAWFVHNEKTFVKALQSHENVEETFINPLYQKLELLEKDLFFLAGMQSDTVAELIITADGNVKRMVFAEQLISQAPTLPNWNFTALKQAQDANTISTGGYEFNSEKLSFYANEHKDYPDLIDLVVTHPDYVAEDATYFEMGVGLFLDTCLGELQAATLIDNITVTGTNNAAQELIPLDKLNEYLKWRQKEFIEKYEGTRRNTENDSYASFEARTAEDKRIIGICNTALMDWEAKASHPWVAKLLIAYSGDEYELPSKADMAILDEIEDAITAELKDIDGYLNVGRTTGTNLRTVYFGCKEFRKPSLVLYNIKQQYKKKYNIEYYIFKDKYWNSMDIFRMKQ